MMSLIVGLSSCTVKTAVPRSGKDPYGVQITPAVRLEKSKVLPAHGKVGDTIKIFGSGIAKHLDEVSILFNGQKAKIMNATDTSAEVIVPPFASTGNINARVKQEYSFGPKFRVDGDMEVDQSFPSVRGADGTIMDIASMTNGQYIIVGDFTNYDNANISGGINRVARINHDGTLDHNFDYGKKLNGKYTGTSSIVNCVASLEDTAYLVAGNFSRFSGYNHVYNIARLNYDGSLDTMTVDLPSSDTMEVSSLFGGVLGSVNGMHVQDDGKIILTGFFRYYVRLNYDLTAKDGRDSLHLDSTLVNYIVRINQDGSLDKTYHFDQAANRGKSGANGPINSSLLLPNGKLIIAGNFTKYDGEKVNRIARLNTDGSLDPTFKPGAGSDQEIYDVVRQSDGKLIIGGNFNSFDNNRVKHIARLNADGSFDNSFEIDGEGPNGPVFNLGVMPSGEVLVSGFFVKYNDIIRNGFVVLNHDGTMNNSYNTNGGLIAGGQNFSGLINGFLQLPSENAFLAIGSFTKFDRLTNNRIMKINY